MSGLNVLDWTPEFFVNNNADCSTLLENADALKDLPSLNNLPLDSFKDGQLVRFQGMIQDMYTSEIFFQNYQVKNTITGDTFTKSGMYRDTSNCQANEEIMMDSDKNEYSERQTYVVISIPGLNEWAKGKRAEPEMNKTNSESPSIKRVLEEDENQPMDTTEPVKKKEKSGESTMDVDAEQKCQVSLSKDHLLNFPIPIKDGKACHVKFYGEGSAFKLNQMVDIIGFISLDPTLSCIYNSDDTMDDAEIQTHNPPASLIPRLHAIKMIQLNNNDCYKDKITNFEDILSKVDSIRGDLHMMLTQLLFGDSLAADYLICHLISSIYIRKDILCLGNFPLNITNIPIEKYKNFSIDFYNILCELIPKCYLFDCTLDNLNDINLIPKKDYDCNRLTSGILQLSDNTNLIIDETNLTTGKITPNGQLNYKGISELIQFQKLTYDFKFYTVDFNTDIPILILSEKKSFIPCLLQLPLNIDNEILNIYPQILEATKQYLKDEVRLNNIRNYLLLMKQLEFHLDDDITNTIQNDFVQLRKTDNTINADNLHLLMVFSRLMVKSYGQNSLNNDLWKKTFQYENERIARLKLK